ncbi:hypothetical protein [Microbulbifer sp.]|uniref:hypothetical protein n=1 Tax=Microbulbifer sp. TaxID=1908541 RepID=UPI003F31953C
MGFSKVKSACAAGILLLGCALLALAGGTQAAEAVKKSPLRILYVGPDPNEAPAVDEVDPFTSDPERASELRKTRSAEWESFLKEHFENVEVVFGQQYKQSMSAKHDVTIFDALPQELVPTMPPPDATGKVCPIFNGYLYKKYRAATVMIGRASALIGEGRKLKIDNWGRLDTHAHGMKLDHPIFNRPYKIDMRLEEIDTPSDYKYFHTGRDLGPTLPMWRVQTEGYRQSSGFPAGVVSTGHSFDNGVDAEWISGGVNRSGVEATAIGRHANFLHWGFAASPPSLTPSARLAFVNAVHYIAPFDGTPQITRRLKSVSLRPELRELQWRLSEEGSARYLEMLERSRQKQARIAERAKARQQAGETLTLEEKLALRSNRQSPVTRQAILDSLPLGMQTIRTKFGKDFEAYEKFFAENMDYLFPADDDMDVDEEAKALGIANSDVRLLDTAVEMLKKGDRVKMARELLLRYTNESFKDAAAWAAWLQQNRERLYFSEGDGYKFIVLGKK